MITMENQNKIDELKDTISRIINDDMYWILDEDDSRYLAEMLIEEGYRKASDVAREIFDEFTKLLDEFLNRKILCQEFMVRFAELKKEIHGG